MEHVMELASPKAVFDLYCLLSNDDKCAFIRLLGQSSTAESARLHMSNLSHKEQARFAEMMLPEFAETVYPVVLQAACQVARSQPNLTGTELQEAADRAVKEKLEEHER